jgi:hypothetical protein
MNRWARYLAVFVAATAISGTGRAQENLLRWSFEAGSGASYLTNRNFDFVAATDALPVGAFRLSYIPNIFEDHLQVEIGFVTASLGGMTFQTWQTQLQVNSFDAGFRFREPFARYFVGYARIVGLLDLDVLGVGATDGSNKQVWQQVVTGGAELDAGLEWNIYNWQMVGVGVLAEFGYAFRVASNFNHVMPSVEQTQPSTIPITGASLGTLDTSGIQYRFAAVLHF